ncbi:MAG: hypothetical protein Q7S00_01315 [bacterium]|nr:hypothetical protein [bacterium]
MMRFLILLIVIVSISCEKKDNPQVETTPTDVNAGKTHVPFTPDTEEAPVLTLPLNGINFADGQIVQVHPMGIPEGTEGQTSEEIEVVRAIPGENIRSYVSGIVSGVGMVDGNQSNNNINIRYGRNYVILHLHVSNVPSDIVVGRMVQVGDLLGTTQSDLSGWSGRGFWELAILKKEGAGCYFVCPVDYFDAAGQTVLNELARKYNLSGRTEFCYTKRVDNSVCNPLDEYQ